MLAGLQIFVPLEWGRFGLWLAAILLGGAASAAAGAALGAAAREVRAVSLLAFMVTLPVAFLSLVPSGTVGSGLFDVIKVITALFPFKPGLEAITSALEAGNGGIGTPLLHLAILTLAYAAARPPRPPPLRPRLIVDGPKTQGHMSEFSARQPTGAPASGETPPCFTWWRMNSRQAEVGLDRGADAVEHRRPSPARGMTR